MLSVRQYPITDVLFNEQQKSSRENFDTVVDKLHLDIEQYKRTILIEKTMSISLVVTILI